MLGPEQGTWWGWWTLSACAREAWVDVPFTHLFQSSVRTVPYDGLHATGIEPVGLTLRCAGAKTPGNEESKHLKSTTHQALLGEVGGWTSESETRQQRPVVRSTDRCFGCVGRASREPRTPSLTAHGEREGGGDPETAESRGDDHGGDVARLAANKSPGQGLSLNRSQ